MSSVQLNNVVYAGDLLTLQQKIKFFNIYYFFTNPEFDKIKKYLNNSGFTYYNPALSTNEHLTGFLHWQINDNQVYGDDFNGNGLSCDVSAFMHNIENYTYKIQPIKLNINNADQTKDIYFILPSNPSEPRYTSITNQISAYKYVWLSNDNLIYSAINPSVQLDLQAFLDGYKFSHWTLSTNLEGQQYSFAKYPANSIVELKLPNTIIFPNFIKQIRLTLSNNLNLSDLIIDNAEYDISSNITLSAKNSTEHYKFSYWKDNSNNNQLNGNLVDNFNTLDLFLSNDTYNFTAWYEANKYAFTIKAINSFGNEINCTISSITDKKYSFKKLTLIDDYNNTKEITIIPAHGYKFSMWSDNSYDITKNILFDGNKELCAVFSDANKIKVNVFAFPEYAGIVKQSFQFGEYFLGDSVLVSTSPLCNDVYVFDYWTSNGSNKLTTSYDYTINNIQQDINLTAVYKNNCQIFDENSEPIFVQFNNTKHDLVYRK